MPALSNFLNDELHRRGWSIPDFVEQAAKYGPGMSTSNAYLIIRDGKDNVRQDTLDLIAATLSMSPADLMVSIGKGSPSDDDLLAHAEQMKTVLRGIDRVWWSAVVEALTGFGRALPGDAGVTSRPAPPVTSPTRPTNNGKHDEVPQLPNWNQLSPLRLQVSVTR